eukprot:5767867-Pleurochrysis_carterae.AAC.2
MRVPARRHRRHAAMHQLVTKLTQRSEHKERMASNTILRARVRELLAKTPLITIWRSMQAAHARQCPHVKQISYLLFRPAEE